MKLITFALFFVATAASAQWSNTTNLFADSLHTPASNAPKNQVASLVLQSYPDSGYFVIWQDHRDDQSAYQSNFSVIYAQKYDKNGVAQWAANGVPISSSPRNQHYTFAGQYRNRSYAATDSAGGFYIAYANDSVTNYVYERVCVQHMQSNGTPVFPGAGAILFSSTTANMGVWPQLVADGRKGFFISYIRNSGDLAMYCYRDNNGNLQSYGGGKMNENAIQQTNSSPCGNYTSLLYYDATVNDYHIFSDLQGGCNVVMDINVNGSGNMIAYNKLWRAKRDATTTEATLGPDYSVQPSGNTYVKDNVYRLYFIKTDRQDISCGSSTNVYTVTQFRLVQLGYQVINGGSSVYDLSSAKGVTVPTSGNINVTIVSACERGYSAANGVSDAFVRGYSVKEEIYDSIPYQRASFSNPNYPGYNTIEPVSVNKLNFFRDTLLAGTGNGVFDFSLAGGGGQFFSGGLLPESGLSLGYRNLRMQHLAVQAITADSLAVVYKTNVGRGVIVGQDQQNYSYGGQYDIPMFTVNRAGNALFYIKESNGSTGPARVSPIFNGVELAWGAMGRTVGSGIWNGSFYDVTSPVVALDPVSGRALMSWTDTRNNATTGIDIYQRHLDNLNDPSYLPPYKRVRAVPNPYGPVQSTAVLYGTSRKFSNFEVNGPYGPDAGVSPAVDISDNYNLGKVTVSVYENTGAVRTYNGKPYLDRSFTITPEHNPNGAATVSVRLFFTTAEFNALKAADPSINTPGDLMVIKQPSGSGSTYTVVAGEQTVLPQSWAAVYGGYYIEIQITSFSNFFIFKSTAAPLPLTWLGIQARWESASQARVTWQVADEHNVQRYTVQYSADGVSFTDACTSAATGATQYDCLASGGMGRNYYRVMETDYNGVRTYSRVVLLRAGAGPEVAVYPNPAGKTLYVDGLTNYRTLQIADGYGKIVLQQTITTPAQTIDISRLAPGSYVLLLTGEDAKTLKFIKK